MNIFFDKKMFCLCQRHSPCVLFIDEIEAILQRGESASKDTLKKKGAAPNPKRFRIRFNSRNHFRFRTDH